MRAPWTDFSAFFFDLGVALNSLPQTTQRVALSAKRVPQVGQSLVEVVSGLIILRLYHAENDLQLAPPVDACAPGRSPYPWLKSFLENYPMPSQDQ
jgi:hypothetical protein